MKPSFILAHIALFTVNLIYAANYSIAKEVMPQYIPPMGFILLRVVFATALFWGSSAFIKETIQRADIKRFILCGLFGVAMNQLFFFKGLNLTSPIHAALLMLATPILVILASNFINKEVITTQRILGIFLGAIGATILLLNGKSLSFSADMMLGDLMILINAASYGVYLVLVRGLMQKYHYITVTTWVFSIGLCFVFPFGVSDIPSIQWHSFSPMIWLAFFYVLFFVTFVAYLLNSYAMRTLSPAVVSIYIYLQPLLATFIAVGLGKDSFQWYYLYASILIGVGVWLVSVKK